MFDESPRARTVGARKTSYPIHGSIRRSRSTMVIYTTVVECFKILFVSLSIYLSDAILLRKGIG